MKKTIGILFGGQSSEHEISCISASNIISGINTTEYELLLIGITKEGRWLFVPSAEQILDGTWKENTIQAVLSPDAVDQCLLLIDGEHVEKKKLDVVFPALHGLYGEDGTVQGILELSKIPYVGCGVLASAMAMDKISTKRIVEGLGIRQAAYVCVMSQELENMEAVVRNVEEVLPYPVFIKPSNAGSSCGVSKANNKEELKKGLLEASHHDRRILVEEMIVGRELECAVFGGSAPEASGVGEILAAAEFYDYEAKYHNPESQTNTQPELPDGKEEEIRNDAIAIFKALDGYGLSRVDFFLTQDGQEVIFNEMNTLPGFTGISMYPMLWEKKGISKSCLVEKLIQNAFQRG